MSITSDIANLASSLQTSVIIPNLNADTLDGYNSTYFTGQSNTALSVGSSAASNTVYLQGALNQTNTDIVTANTNLKSYVDGQISSVNSFVQSSYNTANTKFSSSGGIISGAVQISSSLLVTGNLTVSGNVTTVSANNLAVQDNMIYLNSGSTVANPDLGIAGNYNDGTYRHAGFFRDATDGVWKIFDNYLPEPDVSPYIDTSNSSFRIASFQANNVTYGGTLTGSANVVNIGSGQIYKDSSGNVGIGTSSPTEKLHISNSGDVRVLCKSSSTGEAAFVSDWPSTNGYGGYYFSVDGNQRWRIGAVGQTGSTPPLTIYQLGSGERLRIDTSGRVGIGLVPSTQTLEVLGSIAAKQTTSEPSIHLINSNSDVYLFNSYTADQVGLYDGTASRHLMFYNRPGSYWSFYTAANERMRIDSSGNIGIGSTPYRSISNYTFVSINGTTASGLDIGYGGNRKFSTVVDSGGVYLTNASNTQMSFGTNDVERVRIDNSGNLLIGTTNISNNRPLVNNNGSLNLFDTGSYNAINQTTSSTAGSNGGWVFIGDDQGDASTGYARCYWQLAKQNPGQAGSVTYEIHHRGDVNYHYGGTYHLRLNFWYSSDRNLFFNSASLRCISGKRDGINVVLYKNGQGVWLYSNSSWGYITARKIHWEDARERGAAYCACENNGALNGTGNQTTLPSGSVYTLQADGGYYLTNLTTFNG